MAGSSGSGFDNAAGMLVIGPGGGARVGNVEFLARSSDTPRFNLAIVAVEPHQDGPEPHVHEDEDDAFFVLEGQLTVCTPDGDEASVLVGPGTFVLIPPGVIHTFANHGDAVVRMLNIHAPSGLDRRINLEQAVPLSIRTARLSRFD